MATGFLIGSATIHLIYTFLRAVTYGHHPMASVFEILSTVALAMALVYLMIEIWRRNKSTAVFVLPFVFFIQLAASIGMSPTREIKPILKNGSSACTPAPWRSHMRPFSFPLFTV